MKFLINLIISSIKFQGNVAFNTQYFQETHQKTNDFLQ